MNAETLEFPPIDTAAAAPSAVAALAALQPDLAQLDLQAVALVHFAPAHADAAKACETLAGVVHDLSTPTKLADAKSLRHRLINQPLADARKVSTGLKSKLTAVSKAVGDELKAIEAEFDKADKLITPQIEKRDAEIAEEKRLAAEKESARVQLHRDNLAKLAGYVEHARGLSSSRIAAGIEMVTAIEIDRAAWEEFADRAEEQKAVTIDRMRALHAEALADEDRARVAAEQKAEADRLAAERAEIERQRAELLAQQEAARQEREAKAEAEERQRVEAQRKEQNSAAQPPQQVLKAEPATADATDRGVSVISSPSVGSMGAGQAADAAPSASAAAPRAGYARTLRLGEIQSRLAPLSITAEGLAQLGFPAHTERGLKMYWPGDFPAICRAISARVLQAATVGELEPA